MLATERKHTDDNQIDKLDPKKAQMIRRNISVYRKTNQRLKEIRRDKLDRSRRQSLEDYTNV